MEFLEGFADAFVVVGRTGLAERFEGFVEGDGECGVVYGFEGTLEHVGPVGLKQVAEDFAPFGGGGGAVFGGGNEVVFFGFLAEILWRA